MVAVWLVTTTTLAIGLLTIGVESAAGSDVALRAPERPEPAGPSTAPAHPSERYPSVRYAGLTWSMMSSRVVNGSGDEQFVSPIVVAEVVVANTTADTPLRVREADVALRWADGRLDPIDRFEQFGPSRRLLLQPGQIMPLTVVVKPGVRRAVEPSELSLEIGERGRIPVLLPLVGAPEAIFPIEAEISANPVLLPDPAAEAEGDGPADAPRWLVVAPKAIRFDAEFGLYRAGMDERVVLLTVSVQRSVATVDAPHLDPDFWALEVDGVGLAPLRIERTTGEGPNEDDVNLMFKVDVDSERLTLMAGRGTGSNVGYPIILTEPLR